MNNLELKKIGIEQLSSKEAMETSGGALFKISGLLSWIFSDGSWSDVDIDLFGIDIK